VTRACANRFLAYTGSPNNLDTVEQDMHEALVDVAFLLLTGQCADQVSSVPASPGHTKLRGCRRQQKRCMGEPATHAPS
jgi:hypothetical protein